MAGDRGLKGTSPPSPIRDVSPVRVIDTATIRQVRIFNFVGAEVRIEDLTFTPNHDPFANVSLKQEDASDDIFKEIDEYPNRQAPGEAAKREQHLAEGSSTPATVFSSVPEGYASQTKDGKVRNPGSSRFHLNIPSQFFSRIPNYRTLKSIFLSLMTWVLGSE
ncbi:hypothetical protein LIER_39232 [Lithospermum erythrorhizon]|uniref:Uncharacterized protein n=1 Tax=Lithospermum erythrorhizon TaxID=34254 RepID=A0AAV3QFY7_LITER